MDRSSGAKWIEFTINSIGLDWSNIIHCLNKNLLKLFVDRHAKSVISSHDKRIFILTLKYIYFCVLGPVLKRERS